MTTVPYLARPVLWSCACKSCKLTFSRGYAGIQMWIEERWDGRWHRGPIIAPSLGPPNTLLILHWWQYVPTHGNDVCEVSLIFDIRYSTNLHHGPCASNATGIVAGTNYISTSGTAKNAASSLRLEPMGIVLSVTGKSHRSLPLTCDPRFHYRNTNCRGTNFAAHHDRRHISTSGNAKNAASLLRLEPWEKIKRVTMFQGIRFSDLWLCTSRNFLVGWKVCPQ